MLDYFNMCKVVGYVCKGVGSYNKSSHQKQCLVMMHRTVNSSVVVESSILFDLYVNDNVAILSVRKVLQLTQLHVYLVCS